ncbi:hypothetical protein T439DRAFT_205285 [Meredithblackwellia eburnea MCA 4105]
MRGPAAMGPILEPSYLPTILFFLSFLYIPHIAYNLPFNSPQDTTVPYTMTSLDQNPSRIQRHTLEGKSDPPYSLEAFPGGTFLARRSVPSCRFPSLPSFSFPVVDSTSSHALVAVSYNFRCNNLLTPCPPLLRPGQNWSYPLPLFPGVWERSIRNQKRMKWISQLCNFEAGVENDGRGRITRGYNMRK